MGGNSFALSIHVPHTLAVRGHLKMKKLLKKVVVRTGIVVLCIGALLYATYWIVALTLDPVVNFLWIVTTPIVILWKKL